MRVYIYMSIYICIYMYICIYTYMCIYIHICIYICMYVSSRMDQRYGIEVWNGSFKQVWNGDMERGYGKGVVPDLVPDLLI